MARTTMMNDGVKKFKKQFGNAVKDVIAEVIRTSSGFSYMNENEIRNLNTCIKASEAVSKLINDISASYENDYNYLSGQIEKLSDQNEILLQKLDELNAKLSKS